MYISDGFLMKLTEPSCSPFGSPCLSDRGKCNSLPTVETCCGSIPYPCLLCENRLDASSSASPDFINACWCEQMLDSHQAYTLFGLSWGGIIIDSFSWSPCWTNCEDILPDDKFHLGVFCLRIPKLTAGNIWAFEDEHLCRLGKVHCTCVALMREVYDQNGGHGCVYFYEGVAPVRFFVLLLPLHAKCEGPAFEYWTTEPTRQSGYSGMFGWRKNAQTKFTINKRSAGAVL